METLPYDTWQQVILYCAIQDILTVEIINSEFQSIVHDVWERILKRDFDTTTSCDENNWKHSYIEIYKRTIPHSPFKLIYEDQQASIKADRVVKITVTSGRTSVCFGEVYEFIKWILEGELPSNVPTIALDFYNGPQNKNVVVQMWIDMNDERYNTFKSSKYRASVFAFVLFHTTYCTDRQQTPTSDFEWNMKQAQSIQHYYDGKIIMVGVNLPANMYSKGGQRMSEKEIEIVRKRAIGEGYGFSIVDETKSYGIYECTREIFQQVKRIVYDAKEEHVIEPPKIVENKQSKYCTFM